jgi:hypothetical protein
MSAFLSARSKQHQNAFGRTLSADARTPGPRTVDYRLWSNQQKGREGL